MFGYCIKGMTTSYPLSVADSKCKSQTFHVNDFNTGISRTSREDD